MSQSEITEAARLIAQIDAYLKPTLCHQYALTVERRFLGALKAHLELTQVMAASVQPATEQDEKGHEQRA